MFWITSGKPGSSKTCHMLDFILHDKRFKTEQGSVRPVYYRGIPEVTLDWHELSDEETKVWPDHLPDGAVLLVDEAQQIWPVRPPSKPVPVGLTALETHRHHGWDIIFISQDPGLLDTHARKLCNEQFHFSRPFGSPFVIRYHSGSGYVNPSSKSELSACVQSKMGLPKRVFGMYKSAEVHTHKFKPPKVFFLIPVLIVVVIAAVWMFKNNFLGSSDPPPDAAVQQVPLSPGQVMAGRGSAPVDWSKALVPAVRGLPYTAPFYSSSLKVKNIPVVHGCASFETDFSDCTCYTQQGTPVAGVSVSVCTAYIRHGGAFDPFTDQSTEHLAGWRLAKSNSSSGSGSKRGSE